MKSKTKSTHTPGPWTHEDVDGSLDIYGKDGSCVATLRHRQDTRTSRESNARLISACPEMYRALCVMLDAFNTNDIDPLAAMASIEKAKAAIAKAVGEDK